MRIVNYDPIFAAGRGPIAALIAVSGVLFGNGISYLISKQLYAVSLRDGRRTLALFLFLFCMMNVGNFISYVPVRTFTTHADMFTVERGLNVSAWWIAIVLGLPFGIAVWRFFRRILPGAMNFFFAESMPGKYFLLALSSFTIFAFFGSAGMNHYGAVSCAISMISVYIVFPLSILICRPCGKSASASRLSGVRSTHSRW